MAIIKRVSDLRNYSEVLEDVSPGNPVFLTENGRETYAILDIADYEAVQAILKLLEKIYAAEKSIKEQGTMNLADVAKELGMQ